MTTGKIQNLVSYDLNGKNVIRRIGENTKRPSVKQLAVRQKMAFVIRFLKYLGPLIEAGFKEEALTERKSAHNIATSKNILNAIAGEYPEIELDYSKAMIAQGDLLQAINPQAELLGDQLRFSWQNPPDLEFSNRKDQVMKLAYFPESNEVVLEVYGALRAAAEDFLFIDGSKVNKRMEVYMAFVSADRDCASDTVYLGTING